MRTICRDTSALLVVDFQARLMPSIADGPDAVANARRLVAAAGLMGVPVTFTEQNPRGLGGTVAELDPGAHGPALHDQVPHNQVLHKMTFDACRAPGAGRLPGPSTGRPDVVVAGCEAHVCVLQTVLGLLDAGRRVYVVQDAVGARRAESKSTALRRMERHGAEVVTTEMVVFEWVETAEHPRFRDMVALIK